VLFALGKEGDLALFLTYHCPCQQMKGFSEQFSMRRFFKSQSLRLEWIQHFLGYYPAMVSFDSFILNHSLF